jgi:hypothetical protein
MDLGQWIVIGLSVLMVAWFFGIGAYLRQREANIFRWIYRGLKKIGEPGPVETAGRRERLPGLEVSKLSGPFRRIQVNFKLERKENPPLWIFQRLQGNREEVIVRAVFKKVVRENLTEEDRQQIQDALGTYSGALQERGVHNDSREVLLKFKIDDLLEKEAEDFFTTLSNAFNDWSKDLPAR